MSRNNDNAITTAILALASGAFLGAVAALLLAPTSGRETRSKIIGMKEGTSNRIRKYAKDARYRLARKGKAENLEYDGGDAWI